jgi:hypothetical protein
MEGWTSELEQTGALFRVQEDMLSTLQKADFADDIVIYATRYAYNGSDAATPL